MREDCGCDGRRHRGHDGLYGFANAEFTTATTDIALADTRRSATAVYFMLLAAGGEPADAKRLISPPSMGELSWRRRAAISMTGSARPTRAGLFITADSQAGEKGHGYRGG